METKTENAAGPSAPASGSPPSLAEQISQMCYGRSASPDDPANSSTGWRSGYAAGFDTSVESMEAIAQEWRDRGRPNGKTDASFCEWKKGFWAGRFAGIAAKMANTEATNFGAKKTS
jgi:hypothetical protein